MLHQLITVLAEGEATTATPAATSGMEGIITAMTTAFTEAVTNITSTIAAVLPVVLPVVGIMAAVTIGYRMFKRFTR